MRLGLGLALSGGGLPAFYPDATLALDFVAGAYRVGAGGYSRPDFASLPGLTVSRASVGYAERQDGTLVQFGNNVARITDKGLLVEESRTNLALRSGDLSNAAWSPGSVTVTGNQAIAPDGTQTGALVVPGVTVTDHIVSQGVTVTAASYTVSFYAKAAGYTKVGWREATTSGAYATFNLQTGAVISTGAGATNATITPSANGWYRIAVTWTGVAQAQIQALYVLPTAYVSGDPHSNLFAGDGVSGAYLWGAQVELGSFPTSYIPTTSASATRAADSVSVATSIASPFTLLAEYLSDGTNNSAGVMNTAPTGAGTYTGINAQNTGSTTGWWAAGINPGANLNGVNKTAYMENLTSFRVSRNGGAVSAASTSDFTGPATSLLLGQSNAVVSKLNNYLRRVVLYPTAFSDAALQGATQ